MWRCPTARIRHVSHGQDQFHAHSVDAEGTIRPARGYPTATRAEAHRTADSRIDIDRAYQLRAEHQIANARTHDPKIGRIWSALGEVGHVERPAAGGHDIAPGLLEIDDDTGTGPTAQGRNQERHRDDRCSFAS